MRRRLNFAAVYFVAWFCVLLAANNASAQVKNTYVPLGAGAQALLWEPASSDGKSPATFILAHPSLSYMNHLTCRELAGRGFRILCVDTPYANNRHGWESFEAHVPAIKASVEYLRKTSAAAKIILIGYSAGGPMMTFYQNVAQNGPSVCQGAEKLLPCAAKNLTGLPPADGLLLLDSHIGEGALTLTYVDPAIVDPKEPARRDPELDMFDARNGYNAASRGARYSQDFIQRFLAAQAKRMDNLIQQAQNEWGKITAGKSGLLPDNMAFNIPGANAARIFQADSNLARHTKGNYTLLKADGTTPTQVVQSVRAPSGQGDDAMTYARGALPTTVRGFLASKAIRTKNYNITADDMTGIDWKSSTSSTPSNIEGVSVPLLIVAMSAHYFVVGDEIIYNRAGSKDKTLAFNEGADHSFRPCSACAIAQGLPANGYGDTVKRQFDYIAKWANSRFQ